MTRFVAVDPDSCVACHQCEYVCAYRQTGDFQRSASYIRVNFYPEERACVPLTCMHCDEAWCLEICPAGAISRDGETGAVMVDRTRCAGCKMCLLACPYGNVHFDSVQGVSGKCDLCEGDPACVRICGSGALRFMDTAEVTESRRETVDAVLRRVLRLDKAKK
jgi:anaerobic carbon-monoxide dehydrogenase iron sulfur subunit